MYSLHYIHVKDKVLTKRHGLIKCSNISLKQQSGWPTAETGTEFDRVLDGRLFYRVSEEMLFYRVSDGTLLYQVSDGTLF